MTKLLSVAGDASTLRYSLQFLGLMGDSAPDWISDSAVDLSDFEMALASAREAAMKTKDFAHVDALKSALLDAGVEVQMSKDGVKLTPKSDFDPAKLDAIK